jgi:hypothetical protein
MPYIKKEERPRFDSVINQLIKELEKSPPETQDGQINYIVTRLLNAIYTKPETRYFKINRALGVLSCIMQEFYRRKAAIYEDKKIEENSDVD